MSLTQGHKRHWYICVLLHFITISVSWIHALRPWLWVWACWENQSSKFGVIRPQELKPAGEGKVKEATQIEEHTIRSDRALLLFYGCIFILPALPSPTVHTAHFLSPNTIPWSWSSTTPSPYSSLPLFYYVPRLDDLSVLFSLTMPVGCHVTLALKKPPSLQ